MSNERRDGIACCAEVFGRMWTVGLISTHSTPQDMRKFFILAAFALSLAPGLHAQENVGGIPYALRTNMDRSTIPTVHAEPFDADAQAIRDAQSDGSGAMPAYGKQLALDADMNSAGLWSTLPNGDHIWRLRVVSDGALGTELFFDDLFLPPDATLHIYDDRGEQLIGGFTAYNNTPSGIFSTARLDGEACILEYYEPRTVIGMGHFRIASVGHTYRLFGAAKSGACEVDVNCYPELTGFEGPRDAVVRVGITHNDGSMYWCSGALVNNVRLDCKPYFLTANHCGKESEVDAAHFLSWKFYFKYQRSACGSGSASSGKVMTGCVKRGSSDDNGGASGSDYLLLQTNNPVPNTYTPYWCGWDANNTAVSGSRGIHHPSGDVKKISTTNGTLISTSWQTSSYTHWLTHWAATTHGHGVTEPGSSGSPLLNSDGRIIGTLSAGSSDCTTTGVALYDLYGKMSYHWQSDPGPTTDHLNNWLDPDNTGTLVLNGSYGPCGTLGIHASDAASAPMIFPNPASDHVLVTFPDELQRVDRIDVLDITGRIVKSFPFGTVGSAELDLRGWAAGTYIIQLNTAGVRGAGARLEVVE